MSVLAAPASPGGSPLRRWQTEALAAFRASPSRDFLAVATPGAGKTTFALQAALELLANRTIEAVTVVTPTEHLKQQWASAAAVVGIPLDPELGVGRGSSCDFLGSALTYAGVATAPHLHRARTDRRRTLVILDELHHAGDALTWGEALREAFEPATRRLGLTGTPFRTDVTPIPFVTYAPDADGRRRSVADYTYNYGQALREGVVRPVMFLAYSGSMRWRTSAGDEIAAGLSEPMTQDLIARAWRTALDPAGDWIPHVLAAADRRLTEVRRTVPDAAGLVLASDSKSARAYAARLREATGTAPAIVLSDEAGASARIARFAASDDRWLVAVRMVSEGVDIPRLSVGVYATSVSTPLFFSQAVGRFVRARRPGEMASLFLPSVPTLLAYAAELEVERDHVLDRPLREGAYFDDELISEARRRRDTPGDQEQLGFEALEAEATFDRVLFDGGEFGAAATAGSVEEEEYLGLPGLLEPGQVATLLADRARRQLDSAKSAPRVTPAEGARGEGAAGGASAHVRRGELRRELNTLVSAWHHRTKQAHAAIHAELRRACGGPPTPQASADELADRIAKLRQWATTRSR